MKSEKISRTLSFFLSISEILSKLFQDTLSSHPVSLLAMADAKYQDRVTKNGKYNPVITYSELAKACELSSQHRAVFRHFGKLGLDFS
jgi:hypothetical protein